MAACRLHSAGGRITHVVHIQFDHLHLRRDNPNVPSDLEEMPHLYKFLTANGVIAGDHHAVLLANSATDVLTIASGLYGDRMGMPISDSYGYYRPDGSVGFASAYAYWTATAPDGFPQMVTQAGKTAPAPWVAFTRAGCDVGIFAMANMALESIPSDVAAVFGEGTAQARAAATDPSKAKADFLGIAVHCAQASRMCADPVHATADRLPDEPGGYANFHALFGNANVQPIVSPSQPIKDLDGQIIMDAYGHPGFPNLFAPNAAQSLGYAAAMLEAGIPVVYAFIGDAHQDMIADPPRLFGPGEAAYVAHLAAADGAFAAFIDRLGRVGITKDNTLFVIASDESGHFASGAPVPQNCDGTQVPCSYPSLGEYDASVDRLLGRQFNEMTGFDLHFDTAPCFYIHGDPAATEPVTRSLEQNVSLLTAADPHSSKAERLGAFIADRATMKLLHMVTASPARTPSFAAFGAPDYFQMTAGSRIDCAAPPACIERDPSYAWTHGGVDPQMSRTWFGLVGPGVRQVGIDTDVFTDHADIRPTMLALLGLTDDYVHDGRVVVEFLADSAVPPAVAADREAFISLAALLKQIDAPLGEVDKDALLLSTRAIADSDQAYEYSSAAMDALAIARDGLAKAITTQLEQAAFANVPIDQAHANSLIASAQALIADVEKRAGTDGVSPPSR